VFVVRAFVRLREALGATKALAAKLDELERRVGGHDEAIADLIDAIRALMAPPETKGPKPIGFEARERGPWRCRKKQRGAGSMKRSIACTGPAALARSYGSSELRTTNSEPVSHKLHATSHMLLSEPRTGLPQATRHAPYAALPSFSQFPQSWNEASPTLESRGSARME